MSFYVRIGHFPCAGSVTGNTSWPKECVVSWELLELAVCQHAQGVLGESARLQELTSVFRCRSCFFLGVLDVTRGNDNVGGSRVSSTAKAAKPKSGGTLH